MDFTITYHHNGNMRTKTNPMYKAVYDKWEKLVIEEYFDEDGKKHREEGPAVIYYDEDGKVSREEYYHHGVMHNTKGAAYIEYIDGNLIYCEYHVNGVCDNGEEPALLGYYPNGAIKQRTWYINNKTSKHAEYYQNGHNKVIESYNDGTPVTKEYIFENGQRACLLHYNDEGNVHNAVTAYNPDGSVKRKCYFDNGELLSVEE